MADTPRTPSNVALLQQGDTVLYKWTGLDGDDTGIPVDMSRHPDMAFQAYAESAWGGATLTMQSCLDTRGNPNDADHANAKWQTMTDTTETPLTATADTAAAIQILATTNWVRPSTSGGTGADIVVYLKGMRR